MIKEQSLTHRLVGEIIARFEKRGFKLVALKQMSPSQVSNAPSQVCALELTPLGAPREALRRPRRQGLLQGFDPVQ
jgi:hypothetical protein